MNVFDIQKLAMEEEKRQAETLNLIPSENYPSKAVREAVGSLLSSKYAEGYVGRRYYQGARVIDQIEQVACEEACRVFGVEHVNVQPYSGSIANSAVQMAVLAPGDTLMGMALSGGGHLTHGHPKVTLSGSLYKSVQFDVDGEGLIDYEEVRRLAIECSPKMIIAGTTAYPRIFDWKKFSEIASEVGAWLVADISHIAGLVVGGVHPSPVPYAHLVTTTTHKTLRGPRGAMIMVTKKGLEKDDQIAKKVDRAVFPGLQGGPQMNSIAGIAIALAEASTVEFGLYAKSVVDNAKALSEALTEYGFKLATGGTDNHLMVVDLREMGIGGKEAAVLLEESGIVVNANTVPHDPNPASKPSGIRLGTPAITTRGMGVSEMKEIAKLIKEVLVEKTNRHEKVQEMLKNYPIV